jgi:uroporphyrinogen decarboxylase
VEVKYSSYERVRAALEHKESDRIPFDIGGAMVTGINIRALRNLKNYLGMSGEIKLWDKVTQLAETGNDVIEKLGIDVKNVGPEQPSNPFLTKDLGLEDEHYRIIDEFGIGWQMPKNEGYYYDLYLNPLIPNDLQGLKRKWETLFIKRKRHM